MRISLPRGAYVLVAKAAGNAINRAAEKTAQTTGQQRPNAGSGAAVQNNTGVHAGSANKAQAPATSGGSATTTSIDNLLKPNGQFVGRVERGATSNIRTVSQQEFRSIKNNLLQDAKEVGGYSNGRGTWYELPNGDRFGIRGSSKYGETLDFNF